MSGRYILKASFALAIAGVVASTSLAYAINPNADARGPTAEQQVAYQVKEMANRISGMEDQIAKLNDDLTALHEQQSQLQKALRVAAPEAAGAKH